MNQFAFASTSIRPLNLVRNPKISSMIKPAPTARKVVSMMAEYKDRSYKSLLPPIGRSPMDPKLPKMIEEW